MKAKTEKTTETSTNPVLSVDKNGTVLYSNEADHPLLNEWGVGVGGKLPSHIGDTVQRVISRNSPEKTEVNVGKRIYLVVFSPLPELECVNISGFDINGQIEVEEELRQSKTKETENIELADIINAQAIQFLMDDFYKLTHIPIGIIDIKGNVLVGVGWQDICTKFHRVHPETCKYCIESDTKLSLGVSPGQFRQYKCKNNIWDISTPIIVEGQHIGNIFLGQFLFEDEHLDYELFRSQAKKYGFSEEEYIAALEKVPRFSREAVDAIMSFFMKLASMLSQLSHSNFKLSQSLAEQNTLLEALRNSEEKYRNIVETANEGIWVFDAENKTNYVNNKMAAMLGYSQEEIIGKSGWDFTDEGDKAIIKLNWEKRRQSIDESHEFKFIRRDGSPLWMLVNTKSLLDKDGKFTGSMGMLTDITSRKEAERALKQAYDNLEEKVKERTAELEETYKVLVENERRLSEAQKMAHIGIWDWDLVTDKMYWSDEMYRIFGHDPRKFALSYNAILSRTHPDDRENVDYAVKKAFKGVPFSIDHRIILADRENLVVHTQGEVIFDEKDRPVRMRGTVQDITERKKAEEKIQILADVVESSQDAIGTISLDSNIISWNKGAEKVYGYSVEEILGKCVSILAPSQLNNETTKLIEKVKQGDKIYQYETLRLRKDGKTINVSITLSPVFDMHGKLIAVSFISRDITERKRVEEKLRESEEKYRNIVETANEGISIIDAEERIAFVNTKIEDMFGYSSEELIGRSMWEVLSDESKANIKHLLKNEWKNVNRSLEIEFIHKDGSPVWTHTNSKALFDNDGKIIGILNLHTDITESKKAEEAFRKFEIARKKEIHHRIKNNLQVISSLLDLQTEKFKGRKDIKDSEVLSAFTESMDRVYSIALIHEELYKGKNIDVLNFSQYVKKLADNLRRTYNIKTDVNLSFDLEENLFFEMDTANPLGIVINEIVSNSFKYAFTGRDKGEIKIKLLREENGESEAEGCKSTTFVLSISDNGIGIPKNLEIEDLDSLGLQLVTTLVDQLDGRLELKRDNGTEFIIWFAVNEIDNQASALQQLVD